jgi:hypothetical protein
MQLVRFGDGTAHSFRRRREHQLGPEHREQHAPLDTHALRHGEDQLVALGCRDKGERDPGVAGGWLDDRRAGLEFAVLLRPSIMARPMRSLTLPSGLPNSPLTRAVAGKSLVMFCSRTKGVWPMVSVMAGCLLLISFLSVVATPGGYAQRA